MPPLLPLPAAATLRCACIGLTVAMAAAAIGCKGTTPKVSDPVVGPPPPRTSIPQSGGTKTAALDGAVDISANPFDFSNDPVAASETEDEWTELVARVNGTPIFASEVLERFRGGLEQMRAQVPAADYARQRRELLMAELPAHIEQAMLNGKLRETFGGEMVNKVAEQLEPMFADRVVELKAKTNTKTISELEDFLHSQGTSIAAQQRAFTNQQMAGFYMSQTLEQVPEVTRNDIVQRYRTTVDEFTAPEDVKWQQLAISYAMNGGRSGALAKLEQAVGDLQSGESFDYVVGQYSDGVMRDRAGIWDYVTRGALVDQGLETQLFTLDVGEISPPIRTEKAFLLVRVIDRRPERVTPLKDVQDSLRETIEGERREKAAKKMLAELWQTSNIQTALDGDPVWEQAVADRRTAVAADSDGSATL